MPSIFGKMLAVAALALALGLPPMQCAASAQAPALASGKAPSVSGDLESRHAALRKRDDLQFEFTPPPKLEPVRTHSPNWIDQLLNALGPFFNVVFWVALAAGAMALFWFVGREAWASRANAKVKQGEIDTQATDYRPEEGRARALLAEADRLAAEGRYDEAVRTLLHRSINDIEERSPNAIKKAQTSREISRLPVLPEAVRDAFAPITRAVEESWFGGRAIDADRYQACRKAYADFALPEAWAQTRTGARA